MYIFLIIVSHLTKKKKKKKQQKEASLILKLLIDLLLNCLAYSQVQQRFDRFANTGRIILNEWCYQCYCEEITLDKDYHPRKLYLHINPLYRWPAELGSPKCVLCSADCLALAHAECFPTFFCSMV